MSINSKKTVKEFLKTYSLKEVNESTLINVLEKQGYTVVFFNSIYNDSDVSNIIQALNLEDYILSNRGFTYANDKYRLVFINEDLSEEERIVLLAHEEGHIYCNHTTTNMIIGNDVLQEYEANEFAHYLLHPTKLTKTKLAIKRKKKLSIAILFAVVLVGIGTTVGVVVSNQQSYQGNYYITETGSSYHKKDCMLIKNKNNVKKLTKKDYDSKKYKPCEVCLPND